MWLRVQGERQDASMIGCKESKNLYVSLFFIKNIYIFRGFWGFGVLGFWGSTIHE